MTKEQLLSDAEIMMLKIDAAITEFLAKHNKNEVKDVVVFFRPTSDLPENYTGIKGISISPQLVVDINYIN